MLSLGLCLVASAASPEIISSHRTVLQEGIVHYTFDVDLGPDEFDTIRLHRIVKERRPYWPVATKGALFMLPGSPNFFEQIFMQPLISTVPDWDQSVTVFLAKNQIDVWGMDYAWALVPMETTDFGFMQGWGLEREIDYAEQGIAVARSIRLATGQGYGRLHLLGFSYGVPLAYGIANNETLLPPGRRQVKGLIPVDYEMKVDNETERLAACAYAEAEQALIDSGTYHDDTGILFFTVGYLAKTAPDDISPFFPLFTNWQFALFAGAVHDPWHFVGGEFDELGIPTGLRFTDPELWVDLAQAGSYYLPLQAYVDLDTMQCDEVDVPFDDHLGEITLPILAVGAAGGASPYHYTASLTATKDFQEFTVQLLSDDEYMLDFGHADLFCATDAEELVWQPMLDWLLAHRERRTFPPLRFR
jgi:hypothetical protein